MNVPRSAPHPLPMPDIVISPLAVLLLLSVLFCPSVFVLWGLFFLRRWFHTPGAVLQAHKVAQGMSSAVAEIQKDLQREHQSRGGDGSIGADFDEAEVRACFVVVCGLLCVVFSFCSVVYCEVVCAGFLYVCYTLLHMHRWLLI